MLTADEIAGMREDLAPSLPDLAYILHPTRTRDTAGGRTLAYPEAADVDPVPCRASPAINSRDEENVEGEKTTALSTFTLTFEAGTTIGPDDRVFVNGKTYDVIGVDDGRTYQIDIRASAVERV